MGHDAIMTGSRSYPRGKIYTTVDKLGPNLLNVFDGKDATVISGITDYTWMQLLAETGSDLNRWPNKNILQAGLASRRGNTIQVKCVGTLKRKDTGPFGRRLRGRKGPRIAIKAMARKIAILYWRVMVKGLDYAEQGITRYEEQLLANKVKTLNRLANIQFAENVLIA